MSTGITVCLLLRWTSHPCIHPLCKRTTCAIPPWFRRWLTDNSKSSITSYYYVHAKLLVFPEDTDLCSLCSIHSICASCIVSKRNGSNLSKTAKWGSPWWSSSVFVVHYNCSHSSIDTRLVTACFINISWLCHLCVLKIVTLLNWSHF